MVNAPRIALLAGLCLAAPAGASDCLQGCYRAAKAAVGSEPAVAAHFGVGHRARLRLVQAEAERTGIDSAPCACSAIFRAPVGARDLTARFEMSGGPEGWNVLGGALEGVGALAIPFPPRRIPLSGAPPR